MRFSSRHLFCNEGHDLGFSLASNRIPFDALSNVMKGSLGPNGEWMLMSSKYSITYVDRDFPYRSLPPRLAASLPNCEGISSRAHQSKKRSLAY